jgi:hypothetical protein
VHEDAETHDTPERKLRVALGLGLGTTDQIRVCALAGRLTAAAVVTLTATTPMPASAARVCVRLIIFIRICLPPWLDFAVPGIYSFAIRTPCSLRALTAQCR